MKCCSIPKLRDCRNSWQRCCKRTPRTNLDSIPKNGKQTRSLLPQNRTAAGGIFYEKEPHQNAASVAKSENRSICSFAISGQEIALSSSPMTDLISSSMLVISASSSSFMRLSSITCTFTCMVIALMRCIRLWLEMGDTVRRHRKRAFPFQEKLSWQGQKDSTPQQRFWRFTLRINFPEETVA